MATHTSSQAPDNTTDANFRLWGGEVSTQLAALGLVQTADVGQINWATVTRPLAANTVQGYEMWRFNDSFQATAPVFIKLEYGSGGNANRPAIWYQVGDGSDGAGNLTGATSTRQQMRTTANTAVLKNMYYSCDTNRLGICLFQDNAATSYTILLNIERTKDFTGGDTSDGVTINSSATSGGTAWRQQYFQLGVGPTTQETRWGVLAPSVGTGSAGANVGIYPVLLTKGTYCNPTLGVLAAFRADVTGGTTVAFTMYGATHTYYATGNSSTNMQAGTVANIVQALFRFE